MSNLPPLSAISLFSGAGGMDLGFKRAGFHIDLAVEFDKSAAQTLERNQYGNVLCCPVEAVDWRRIDTPDVVFGGPPCQPFSAAGKGFGEYDPRDGIPHFITAVKHLLPRAFVLENVRGLTFKKHRPYLDQVVAAFSELGYLVCWKRLHAERYGVPQFRDRLFVVGFRDPTDLVRFEWPVETHGDPAKFPELISWMTVGDALGLHGMIHARLLPGVPHSTDEPSRTLSYGNGRVLGFEAIDPKHPPLTLDSPATAIRSGGSGHDAPPVYLAMTNGLGRADPLDPARPARAIAARQYKDALDMTGWVENKRKAGGLRKGERLLSPDTPAPAQPPAPGGRDFVLDKPAPTLVGGSAASHTNGRSIISKSQRDELLDAVATTRVLNRPSPTVQSGGRSEDSKHTGAPDPLFAAKQRGWYRRLTYRECAAIQAFPSDYSWPETKTHAYRQIGNAVPPPLAEVVAIELRKALTGS